MKAFANQFYARLLFIQKLLEAILGLNQNSKKDAQNAKEVNGKLFWVLSEITTKN